MDDLNHADFNNLVSSNNPVAVSKAIFELFHFTQSKALKLTWGGSSNNPFFRYIVARKTGSSLLFSCDTKGLVSIYLGNFTELNAVSVRRFLNNMSKSIHGPGFSYIMRFQDRFKKGGAQDFKIENTLVDPFVMKDFQDAVLYLQNQLEHII